ncbi:hypothetical protein LEP1GSC186_3526 [Leptospira noguchii serovar Autumnalis str. ZUN142]|uniref:Uncharacterized protein n=1 Tax=Leptospira noguchii serovar Autumnalis str. ZUN142 TaxID=1085540 RepID=M6UJU8_9LEPT|nr:hypothetical protein LEP1GSC186_3526 [Leptospira noguchii serovar Autumnalis str. ZUN142]
MAHDRAFRSNSFGISTTIAFAFVTSNSRYLRIELLEIKLRNPRIFKESLSIK